MIADAGPGGPATAPLPSRAGRRVRLLEPFETPLPLSSGLMLPQTGLAGVQPLPRQLGMVSRQLLSLFKALRLEMESLREVAA